ncbi:hypothetical protein HpBT318_13500 [Helicobacter pylori]
MVATTISLKRDYLIKKGLVGFSWTTLFFGFFVPIIRGDARWAIIMLISFCCYVFMVGVIIDGMFPDIDKIPDNNPILSLVVSLGILFININIMFAIIYNKQYTTELLESGYEPANEYSRDILQSRGMIA